MSLVCLSVSRGDILPPHEICRSTTINKGADMFYLGTCRETQPDVLICGMCWRGRVFFLMSHCAAVKAYLCVISLVVDSYESALPLKVATNRLRVLNCQRAWEAESSASMRRWCGCHDNRVRGQLHRRSRMPALGCAALCTMRFVNTEGANGKRWPPTYLAWEKIHRIASVWPPGGRLRSRLSPAAGGHWGSE